MNFRNPFKKKLSQSIFLNNLPNNSSSNSSNIFQNRQEIDQENNWQQKTDKNQNSFDQNFEPKNSKQKPANSIQILQKPEKTEKETQRYEEYEEYKMKEITETKNSNPIFNSISNSVQNLAPNSIQSKNQTNQNNQTIIAKNISKRSISSHLFENLISREEKYTKKTWIYLGVLTLITVCCYWFWFFDWGAITAGDWGYLSQNASRELWNWPSMIDRFGRVNLTIQTVPIFAIWGGLSYFFDFAVISRLIYLFPSVLVPLYGSFVLNKYILKSDLGAFVGAIVFNSSIYFLMIRQGHLLLVCGYSVMLWVIYFFMRMINERKIWQAIVTSFLAFLCGSFEFRGLYIVIWLVFLYYIYYNLVESRKWKIFWQTTGLCAITLTLFVLYNLYWLLPFSKMEVLSQNSLFERAIITSEFFDLVRAFSMFVIWWSGTAIRPTWDVPINFFIAPIAAFVGFYLNKTNPKIIFFTILAILGIFLSKQAGEPFPNFYAWLYKNFIGFAAFREASKFYGIISLGYSIMIGSLVVWLVDNWNQKTWQKIGSTVIILTLIGSFLWHNRPMINQEYGALTVPKTLPTEFAKFNDFVSTQKDFFYVLGVPILDNWFSDSGNHQRMDLVNLVQSDWKKVMNLPVRSIENPITTREITTYLLDKPFFEQFSRALGIKYLVVPPPDKTQVLSQIESLGGRDYYIESVKKMPFMKQIEIGTGDLLVFENLNYKEQKNFTKQIYETKTVNNLDLKSEFLTKTLKEEFNFYLNEEVDQKNDQKSNSNNDSAKITGLFETLKPEEIQNDKISQKFIKNPNSNYQFYYNQNRREIISKLDGDKLEIYSQNPQNLEINKQKLKIEPDQKLLFNQKINPKETYYLNFKGNQIQVENGIKSLGFVTSGENSQIGLYQKDIRNVVPNGSFDQGFWSQNYNCSNQEQNELSIEKIVDANIVKNNDQISKDANSKDKTDKTTLKTNRNETENNQLKDLNSKENYLELIAKNQTACNKIDFDIEPNQFYVLDFEIKSDGQNGSFLMGSNDPTAQAININLPIIQNNTWQKYEQFFLTEPKTTRTDIFLSNKAFAKQIKTAYDDFRVSKLNFVNSFEANIPNQEKKFVKVDLNLEDENEISYEFKNPEMGQNWFKNGSFDNGLWADKESCGKEKSNLELVQENDSNAIKLTAVGNIACTRTTIPVQNNTKVLFGWDYKTNTNYISSYLGFSGSDKIIRQPNIFTKKPGWQNYSMIFMTPNDTAIVDFIINTQGIEDSDREIINYFDNFKMITIPDFDDQFYLVETPKNTFEIPTQSQNKNISFNQKKFSFQNVKNDFWLTIPETFNSNWKVINPKNNWQDLFPFQDEFLDLQVIPSNLNQTSWHIDIDYLCNKQQKCQKNSDGSFNLDLRVEFWTQRWLNVGLIISILSFVIALLVLVFLWFKNTNSNTNSNSNSHIISSIKNKKSKKLLIQNLK